MGNIYQFGAPGQSVSGVVSSELSAYVWSIRDILGVEHDSHRVVVSPAYEGYDPFFAPDGTMQLGRIGLEDFELKFGPRAIINHTVNPVRLYTGYMAFRRGIEEARKLDFELHDDLLGAAEEACKTAPRFKSIKDPHLVERELIGYQAARLAAMDSSTQTPAIESSRKNHVIVIRTAAERRTVKKIKGETADDSKARLRAMSHFTMSLSGDITALLDRSLQLSSVRRRS